MLKKNVPFYCAILTANAANTDVTQLSTWADGYCAGGESDTIGYQCGWCSPGNEPPTNCIAAYPGCVDFAYIAVVNDVLRDKSGNIIVKTENNIQTMYKCTTTGWQKVEYDLSGGDDSNCDRYSYYDSVLNMCMLCPDTNVYTDASLADDTQVQARGDNYQYLLTGCNYWVYSKNQYYDKTGTFTFQQDVNCFHDGKL